MSIVAGNVVAKFSFGLQFRVFSIPWVKRNRVMLLCLKGREYNCSSVPVRYSPKKGSKIMEMQSSSPVKGFEKNEFHNSLDGVRRGLALDEKPQNGNLMSKKNFLCDDAEPQIGNRVSNNFFHDDAEEEIDEEMDRNSRVVDLELMEEPDEVVEEIKTYHRKDIHKQDVLHVGKTMQDAEKLAIELLATRAYTAVELRKKLQGKRFSSDITEALIDDFQSRGLINDSLYAESYSRSRWSSSSWGPRRIKHALFKKGVSEADVDKAIKLVFEENESGGIQESKLGMSKPSMDHLFVQASKQWLRGHDVPKDMRRSRIIRWLQYRGFNWGVISFVLKKLESQYPP